MGLHDYETELEAAAVLSRIAAAQSSDPASDDLTVPLAFECAEKDVEIERLRAALKPFASCVSDQNGEWVVVAGMAKPYDYLCAYRALEQRGDGDANS